MSKRIKVSRKRMDVLAQLARERRMKIDEIFWACAAWLRARGERVKNFTIRNWLSRYKQTRRIHPKVAHFAQHLQAASA